MSDFKIDSSESGTVPKVVREINKRISGEQSSLVEIFFQKNPDADPRRLTLTYSTYSESPDSFGYKISLLYDGETSRDIPDELFHHEGSDMSEADSHLIEAALQAGAVHLNDDATTYGFTQENLVRLIRCALNKDFLPLWDNKNERIS